MRGRRAPDERRLPNFAYILIKNKLFFYIDAPAQYWYTKSRTGAEASNICGIVGLFLKDKSLEPQLGALLSEMLITMTDRGPDSAGIAIYGGRAEGRAKITVQSARPSTDFAGLETDLAAAGIPASVTVKSTHAVIDLPVETLETARAWLATRSGVRIMGTGERIEIYKETGLPKDVVARFDIRAMSGSHGIGHTRMATESAVTTLGAHPFSTGLDQCLVHNGSL